MGTHPIFESDFDCLTDSVKSAKWSLATRRPERCAVTCPTDRVVSVSIERVVTVVVAVCWWSTSSQNQLRQIPSRLFRQSRYATLPCQTESNLLQLDQHREAVVFGF